MAIGGSGPTSPDPTRAVAVIGAGAAGLVTARWLLHRGFEPVLFEDADSIGGQWHAASPRSGVWPGMRANSSRVLTCFADLDHRPGTPVYPSGEEVAAYLRRYAERFAVAERVRLQTRVEAVDRAPEGGWTVRSSGPSGELRERFRRVVVATGRHRAPRRPRLPGLRSFAGMGSIAHSMSYKDPERYRDLSVLVVGGNISALEIASDIALHGTRVLSAVRRQRYVLPKMLAGVPTDHVMFTRFAARAAAAFPPEVIGAGLRELVIGAGGSPEQYGAAPPAADILDAGVAQSQHYLPLVAEGRIEPKPGIVSIEGRVVRFTDGTTETVDAILFGTGFVIDLPFLSDEVRATIELGERHLDLYAATFHPDLEGLAFLGLWEQAGPYFPVLELQARWVAYAWSGRRPMPTRAEMRAEIAAVRGLRDRTQAIPMNAMALRFAQLAGVEPDPGDWPDLGRALWFGPLSPAQFRLVGPDRDDGAAARVRADASAFGAIPTAEPSPAQRTQLLALAAAERALSRAGAA
jgi:thioredoxin reductase